MIIGANCTGTCGPDLYSLGGRGPRHGCEERAALALQGGFRVATAADGMRIFRLGSCGRGRVGGRELFGTAWLIHDNVPRARFEVSKNRRAGTRVPEEKLGLQISGSKVIFGHCGHLK